MHHFCASVKRKIEKSGKKVCFGLEFLQMCVTLFKNHSATDKRKDRKMGNRPKKKDGKDLHTAITELILYLKGDDTVSWLSTQIGVHRNQLTAIFEVYEKQLVGEKVLKNTKKKPVAKKLYWGTSSIIKTAQKLKVRVSEIILAAEDVQDGLPPWFQRRISKDTAPKSPERLEKICLEASGCLTYEPLGLLKDDGLRKSTKPNPVVQAHFTDDAVTGLKYFFRQMVSTYILGSSLGKAYMNGEFSDQMTYNVLKKSFDRLTDVPLDTLDETTWRARIDRLYARWSDCGRIIDDEEMSIREQIERSEKKTSSKKPLNSFFL